MSRTWETLPPNEQLRTSIRIAMTEDMLRDLERTRILKGLRYKSQVIREIIEWYYKEELD